MEIKVMRPNKVTLDPERVMEEFRLAKQSLKRYGMKVRDLALVQANPKAVVWRAETPEGPKALKWTGRKRDKVLFTLLAHRHMEQVGFPVPHMIRTRDADPYLVGGERIGFLTDWMDGRSILTDSEEEWGLFIQTLAAFHQQSREMDTSGIPRVKTKLGGWPLNYQSRIGRMKLWYEEARNKSGFYSHYYDLAPGLIGQAEALLQQLVRSDYWDWVKREVEAPALCHTDYGTSNTILTPEGELYVIDLDAVTFDLPIRDLRKVFEEFFDPGVDLPSTLERLVETYTAFRPLTSRQLEVFLIDVQFPYTFYQHAKAAFVYNEFDSPGLIRVAETDAARADAAKRIAALSFGR